MKDCSTCVYSGRPTYDWPCDVCARTNGGMYTKKEIITNYDRIIRKSPEEMADFLSDIYMLEKDAYGDYDPCSVIDGKKFRGRDELIDWLKQEVNAE